MNLGPGLRIEPESIAELHRGMEDVRGAIPGETLRGGSKCAQTHKGVHAVRLLAVVFSSLSSYPKNADFQLPEPIFEIKTH